jgi:hypothetical protein
MATKLTLYFTTAPSGVTGAVQIPGTGDVKILNYALALETLEAELYRQALARLTTGGTDALGNAITGLGVTGPDVNYITEFGTVENSHRDFLTSALGGNWVTTAGATFDFGINSLDRVGVVKLVYAAELTGVSAYLGGVGTGGLTLPSAGGKYLAIAASILGTEARHTAAVAILLNGPTFSVTPALESAPLAGENSGKDTPLTPDQILNTGGTVGSGLTSGGTINPISGPNGFVVTP